jgi:3-hydroxybenzoate 6-monooxygenase
MARPEILVVGGGIGGLAVALSLARIGRPVRVLERNPEFGEIGYGIQLGPNAYHVMRLLGLSAVLDQHATFPKNQRLLDAVSGEGIAHLCMDEAFRGRYRYPYCLVHRRDLHGALLDACRDQADITLETSKELVEFSQDGDRVLVSCADGSQYAGAAAIGADGLWSQVRAQMFVDGPPRPSGHIAYRGAVAIEQVRDHRYLDDMALWAGPDFHMVHYRLRGGTVMNIVAVIESRQFRRGLADFGGPEELDEIFSRATPQIHHLLSHVSKDRHWMLHDRDPIPNWTHGRVTLLGDAAHPSLQYMAQGACMALEDAIQLASDVQQAGDDLCCAFQEYQRKRLLRTARVQLTARFWGAVTHAGGVARDLRNQLLGRCTSEKFCDELDWLYQGIEVAA